MINKDTYSTVLTNGVSASVSMTQPVTNSTTLANRTAVSSTLDNIALPDTRTEGLWVASVLPWAIDAIWSYVSIVKSNAQLTNI